MTYYVYDISGEYATESIVRARARAVSMIEKYPKATSWDIYDHQVKKGSQRPHSAVVFYGKPAGYGWLDGKNQAPKYIYKNGKLRETRKAVKKHDYTKISAAGIPIYKIWYSPLMDSYDVLGRSKNGEWVYGRDYDLKDGIWKGGRYDYDIDNLYKRVGGTYPVVFKNNHRGKTGKF